MSDQFQPDHTWEFVHQANRHRCSLPRSIDEAHLVVGDMIRCLECRQAYRMKSLNSGDQRDPINPPRYEYDRVKGQRE